MKIHIDQIPDSGLELSETCQASSLDLDWQDVKFIEPLVSCAKVTKGINNISVELQIDGKMHLTCSRCLEEFVSPLSKKSKLNFMIDNKKEIDITSNIREEIILNYPLKPLCRQDCLGLCPVCGKNLNQGKCSCSRGRRTDGPS